ncbi:VCBS repeat-containing protein [Streptomyces sp. NBC_01077]|uniref:FG-GAP repeat domain-containing protein n=1 Tax=Streptomyces sp. NBC_01077 TaxID=2903746 RepID=UPI00386AE2D2|nr:VCBS repeat-containing protein [Streptomyces sp. NBC_01077]
MQHRMSRHRLAAALLTLSTVTAVTGTLVTVPATAAVPNAVTGAAGASAATEATLPLDAEVVSAGTTGYLTARKDDAGNPVQEWHTYADGAVLPINTGTMGHDSYSDMVVTSNGGSSVQIRDMKAGSNWSTHFEIASEFKPGSQLVGVVGDKLYVSVPSGTENYRELWSLAKVNGVSQKMKLSSRARNVDYKVVASDGTKLIILGTEMARSGGGLAPSWWTATTSTLSNTVVDWEGSSGTHEWYPTSTGALTATHRAVVLTSQFEGTPEISVDTGALRIPLTGDLTGAVVAGIVGDVILYGVPGTAGSTSPSPLYARNIKDPAAAPYKFLEHFSSAAHSPDGSLLVRGTTTASDGLFRISGGVAGARPDLELKADTGRLLGLQVVGSQVPAIVDLEKPGSTLPMRWTLSRDSAYVQLTLTHTATGKKFVHRPTQPLTSSVFSYTWNGVLDGISAPNGTYTWQLTATPTDGVGSPGSASGGFRVTRLNNPHDYNDNGSTDVLARDASGVLWRDDLFDGPVGGQYKTARRTKIGAGWTTYKQVEAVGSVGGAAHGDLIAVDGSGVQWLYLGKGDGTFATRVKVGTGWQIYDKIAGGSDLDGDNRPDLVATDSAGYLWFYKGTGNYAKPFGPRLRVSSGWNAYNQITAVGNIATSPGTDLGAGDLVARDRAGVLWLFRGTGGSGFGSPIRIGAGWQAFSQLVGAGDVTGDGRPDLIAYGAGGTYVYRSTGSSTAPFSRQTTSLYAGEGSKFNAVV